MSAAASVIVADIAPDSELNQGKYRLRAGWVLRENGTALGAIVGRVGGYGPGTGWYQIAGRPYDEVSVVGLESKRAAFDAIVAELERREVSQSA